MKQTTIHKRWTAVLATTAIIVTTFAAAPSASADPVSVAPGGSVTVRTGCREPVVRPVIPVEAGTASYDADAGILTFTAAANFGGLATVTLQCGFPGNELFPSWQFLVTPEVAAPVSVAPGSAINVPYGSCTSPQVPTVSPSEAGAATYNFDTTVDFTAAAGFTGLALVSFTCSGFQAPTLQFLVKEPEVAGVDATFTPRPAPGPCILIASGANIAFGNVIVGDRIEAPTRTRVSSCAPIALRLSNTVANATSGSAPNLVTLTPTLATPVPANEFRYEINETVLFSETLAVGASLDLRHTVLVGVGSAGLGQSFSTKVTFTATAA